MSKHRPRKVVVVAVPADEPMPKENYETLVSLVLKRAKEREQQEQQAK